MDLLQTAPVQPLSEQVCWYWPEGALVVFQARKGRVCVYPGMVILFDEATRQEVLRTPLTAESQAKSILGSAFVTPVNGSKVGLFSRRFVYTFYHPALNFAILIPIFIANFIVLPVRLVILIGSLAAIIALLMRATPKAKIFVNAVRRQLGQ